MEEIVVISGKGGNGQNYIDGLFCRSGRRRCGVG